jgi:O-antigen ligase
MIEKIVFICLLAVVVWSPLPFGSVEGWSNGLLQVSSIILFIVLSINAIWKEQRLKFSFIQIPILLVIVQGIIQYFFTSLDPYQTKLALFSWLSMGLFFALGVNTIDRNRLKILINALIILGLVVSALAILQHLTANNRIYWFREVPSATPFGAFVNRNHYAGFMEMLVPLPIAILFTEKLEEKWKNFYFASAFIMTASLVLSASRAGLLALVIELILLAFVFKLTRKKVRLNIFKLKNLSILVGVLVVFLLLAKFTGTDSIISRFIDVPVSSQNNDALSRTSIWLNSLKLFSDYPFLGVGLGAYPSIYTKYDFSDGYLRLEQAHNDYLQILTDQGILGGIYLISFLVLFFKYSFENMSSYKTSKQRVYYQIGAFIGCFGILVHSFFDFNLQIPSNALLFVMLCVCATGKFSRNQTGASDITSKA